MWAVALAALIILPSSSAAKGGRAELEIAWDYSGASSSLVLLQQHAEKTRSAVSHRSEEMWVPLQQALSEQRDYSVKHKNAGDVCLTLTGRYMGGLSNTMGFVNAAFDFTFDSSFIFKLPKISPPGHEDGKVEHSLFGQVEYPCKDKVPHYEVKCNTSLPNLDRVTDSWGGEEQCGMSQFMVEVLNPKLSVEKECGCSHVVAVPTENMKWHFHYERSGPVLATRYWKAHPLKSPSQSLPGYETKESRHKAQLVMHVRIGDVEDRTCGFSRFKKHLCPDYYGSVLQSLFGSFSPECLEMHIVTDGGPESADIQFIQNAATIANWPPLAVHGPEVDEEPALEMLARADIVIVGMSGFGRFGATLSRDWAAVIAPIEKHHPLGSFPNVTEVHAGLAQPLTDEKRQEEAQKQLSNLVWANGALSQLKKRCDVKGR